MEHMIYQCPIHITSPMSDSTVRLGIAETFGVFQEGFTQCFAMLGCDNITLRKKHDAFWVITKVRAQFFSRPAWNETVMLRCHPVDSVRVRTHLNCQLIDRHGNPLIQAKQQFSALPFSGGRPFRLSDLGYPTEGFPEAACELPYRSFDLPDEPCAVMTTPVYSQLIDMSMHVNNISYLRLALCMLPLSYLHAHEIEDVEIHYVAQAWEGQTLRVEQFSSDAWYFRICEQERVLCQMRLSFRKAEALQIVNT